MNMQQFEMVMDMVQSMTDGAFTMAVLYMVYLLLVDFLLPVVLVGTVVLTLYKGIIKLTGTADSLIRLRDSMDVGSPGPITAFELEAMLRWVARHNKE